jgi:hypothetical protein
LENLLVVLVLGAPLLLAAWVFDKTRPWLDRKLEGRKIKLAPWTIAKNSPYLGGKWVLWTRTHGHDLNVQTIWTIFVFTVVGLFIAHALFSR